MAAPHYRTVDHLGLSLMCEPASATARCYYGQDSLVLSKALMPAEGRVLDLCAGVGAQALVCARTAASVTAVDIEPAAEKIFRINAAWNGLSGRVEYLVGDLFEPIPAGRQFDLIACNPPFMPVPPGVRFPQFADGGPDGLSIVRRVLAGLPQYLAPEGRCHIVGAIPGDDERPDLSSFEGAAAGARLGIFIACLYTEALDEAMLASCAATGQGDGIKEAFRAHYAGLGATRLYYFLLKATHARQPSVYFEHDGAQRVILCGG